MKTNVFVRTKNVKKFVGLMEDLKKLPPNIPKLALVYGDHGIGKTQTLLWWANKNDAIYIRANNDITQNGLLKIIMEELDISPYWNMQDNFNAILKQLRIEPKIIIVDEVDYLIGYKNAIEILRDIQDNTGSPIVLSGMAFVDKKISRLKHFEDRLFKKLKFEHYSEEDLRDILNQITDLEFSDDAITYLATRTNQFRKIVQTLEQLEKQAKTNQLNVITEDILKGRFNERQNIKIMPPAQKVYA
jgi:DNA transposition AAA+ family ATPase